MRYYSTFVNVRSHVELSNLRSFALMDVVILVMFTGVLNNYYYLPCYALLNFYSETKLELCIFFTSEICDISCKVTLQAILVLHVNRRLAI